MSSRRANSGACFAPGSWVTRQASWWSRRLADVGGSGHAGHSPARSVRGRGLDRAACAVGRAAAAARRALHRLSGAAVGGVALRPAGRRHGDPRRLLDHRLEYRAERRAVRARLAHRQPARDPALHRDVGDHVAGAGRGDCRAHARSAARWRPPTRLSARSPTSRRHCAGWRRSSPARPRRAGSSSR